MKNSIISVKTKRTQWVLMKVNRLLISVFFILSLTTYAKGQEDVLKIKAKEALKLLETSKPVPVKRTESPDAQWFPDAGFGLFMHWGIHSVAAIDASWGMMKNTEYKPDDTDYIDRAYYSLLWQFHPENYDPDKWIKAAKDAGMTYAVLTAKHHDGYTLWPSEYGYLGTKQYMDGRDLLKPYVEACRKYGMKVGFYFSPRDWSYPGFPVSMDGKVAAANPRSPEQNKHDFEKFYEYTTGQISELLTRYGKIDILWFDGHEWPNIKDPHTEKVFAWVRELQPGIIINNRWDNATQAGDFGTPENTVPGEAPEGWWESCLMLGKHWGYSPGPTLKPTSWVIGNLVNVRSLGGNVLLNVGPAPYGTMQPEYYERTNELAKWMVHSKQSLIGAAPFKTWNKISNVPITRKGKDWYLHVLPGKFTEIHMKTDSKPVSVRMLETNKSVNFKKKGDTLFFDFPRTSNGLDDVIVITWKVAPEGY